MNLLDRLWRTVPVLIIGVLGACEDPNDIGDVLNPGENKIEVLYKELDLPANNVFIDSLRTDNTGRLMVGKYDDPFFGVTTSVANTQTLDLRNAVFSGRDDKTNNYIIDSAYLQLAINYYHSHDSLQFHDFKLYTLADTLFSGVFYLGDHTTPRNNTLVGERNNYLYDSEENQVQIDLTNDFVLEILQMLEDNGGVIIDANLLRNQLKGLSIQPGDNNTSVFGFDPVSDNSKLGIYYRVENETQSDTVSTAVEFFLGPNSVSFNNITTDRSSTSITIDNSIEDLIKPITTGDQNLYLQSSTGMHPRFSLQPYHDFLASIENLVINRADIELSLIAGNSTFKYLAKPEDLRFFFYNGGRNINVPGLLSNSISNTLIMANASYLNGVADQLRAVIDEDDTKYSADATLFSQFLESGDIDAQELIVIPSDVTSMNRVILDASSVKMKIFYTIPK